MELIMERELPVKTENNGLKITRICFVCTGNTCRSPMAEAVANAYALERGRSDLRAFSAGLYANDNEPISQHSVSALEAAGVKPIHGRDYHRHLAHTITEEEAKEYDLLIGMTTGHAMELMMRFPAMADKVACMPKQISDPYGGDAKRYRDCLVQIIDGVRGMLFTEDTK